ncbi:PilZ domain-containing protein [Bradyrhizobium sp. DASA03005]|uniref:PilZ domain-containing protein n=1 Tax=Bradyrhizobium TaxID=374 RepID=UPI00155E26CC|nr:MULTISPECIES: PilZ domain-containing protein [Bradyrhizobium]MBR1170331.1 PilZ domain-containing protein [Bradyrhizobium liaoningense]MDD1522704.1 PilZ domain-containing protein [Bradyrhizobium sp. WBAH30]MDD1547138.1 PilZ domain-containing protein [Bradyrhizobium sp. WBAH41]MDD1560719.1 PilZ domain-containing protein [Bradyrhizobium sp. WBAH23]MDD1568183.1 PilZ domain-containing protein [Bradyrhizobium sp. WBAH33]
MKFDGRKAARVKLDHRQPVNLMGSDGTWRRSCVLLDVSQTGAKVEVEGTLDVLKAKEFFMVLSSTGLAYRRCELVWIDGTTAGVHFITVDGKKKSAGAPAPGQNAVQVK